MNWTMFLVANIPLLARRGGCAIKKMPRSNRSGADGVVITVNVDVVTLSGTDHPRLRLHKEASQHFLDGAATPPNLGGEFQTPNCQFIHTFYERRYVPTLLNRTSPLAGSMDSINT